MSVDTPILKDGSAGGAETDLVKNTTTKDFMRDVVEASREVPVLVDFWAPWCGPCRQLTPILEKAVRAAKGAVRLVKLNIDEHPQIPGQMGVQSIPAVFAFQDGRPVDGFMGALPESRVNAFIARLIGDTAGDVAADLEAAEAALAAGDVNTAAQLFGEMLAAGSRERAERSPASPSATSRPATSPAPSRRWRSCRRPRPRAQPWQARAPRSSSQRKAPSAGDIETLRAKLAADPKDAQARFDLALALNAKGDRDGALEELLTLVARNRAWNDDAARKQLVQLFDAWGVSDPATIVGSAKAVVAALRLRPRSASLGLDRPLSQRRRHAGGIAAISAARAPSCCRAPRSRSMCSSHAISLSSITRYRAIASSAWRSRRMTRAMRNRLRERPSPCGAWAARDGFPPSPSKRTAAWS